MKICFLCDLHLPFNKNALQYAVLDWAIENINKNQPDCIVFAGDVTADGNIIAYEQFIERIKQTGIPFLYIPGNSDLRDEKTKECISVNASECFNIIDGIKIFAVNDSNGCVLEKQLDILEEVDDDSIIFMHHPISCLKKESKEKMFSWREQHKKSMLFYGHEHKFYTDGNSVSLQAMDPDKAIGSNPCITYYNTKTRECQQEQFCCSVPEDIFGYFGISCYKPEEQILFAIDNQLKNLELRPNVLRYDKDKIISLVKQWRKQGNTNLSIHLSEVCYENGLVYTDADYKGLISLGIELKAERFVQHVPIVSVKTVKEDKDTLEKISTYIANQLESVSKFCVVGVENMHMTSKDQPDDNRRFGYTPEETLLFTDLLSKKCKQKVGVNFDIGHARNNAPFSQKYQISTWLAMLGDKIVSYHIHQVREENGVFENHTAIDDIYGRLISCASFFKCWGDKKINHAPVIFEMRTENAYSITLETFNKYKAR